MNNKNPLKQVLVEIITIGDEILIGQTVDTNSAFIATLLNLNGMSIKQITSVSDSEEHIMEALDNARQRADIILITGGLGPTKDDLTKTTLCKYFNTSLRFDQEVYENLERIFSAFGKEVTSLNRMQAEVPANCEVIQNLYGTAPGMWFKENKQIIVSMPGVPYEMKAMMKDIVLPKLKADFELPHIIHKTVLTQGIGESFLAELIAEWEDSLASVNIKLAYLPTFDSVRLRVSSIGGHLNGLNDVVDKKIEELKKLIPQYICGYEVFGEDKATIEQILGELLKQKNKTIATAESCTGGYLAHLITRVPGSSAYFMGSIISYANRIKEQELEVIDDLLIKHGAVSQPVVEQMAKSILKKFNVDYGIAISGIAGPTGGSEEKPVGTVWISIASKINITSKQFMFGKNRERNIQKAANSALNMLQKELLLL